MCSCPWQVQNSIEAAFSTVPLTWYLFAGISPAWGIHLLLKASRNPPWNKTLHWEGPQSNSSQQQLWCAHRPASSSTCTILTTSTTMWAYVLLPFQTATGRVLSCLALLWAGTTSNRPKKSNLEGIHALTYFLDTLCSPLFTLYFGLKSVIAEEMALKQ